ncbi:MAG: TetR/AcrR family transcriptional regulator [Trueperaceae bacterium]
MTQVSGTRQRQKADRRERIMQAALELMTERGFTAATYELIADRAGVSRGTVFNYFPYKESILLDYAADELGLLAQRVALRREAEPGWSALGEIRFVFDELGAFAQRQRQLILPLSYELLNPDPARSRAAYLALPLGDLLRSALERGRAEGSVRQDHSVERLVRTLANTFFITALQWAAYRPDRGVQSELRLALDLTLEGLTSASAKGASAGQ